MKFILPVFLILLLSGCVHSYDTTQYQRLIQIVSMPDSEDCSIEGINKLLVEARYLHHYTEHKKSDDAVNEAISDIYARVKTIELRQRKGDMSREFCLLKLQGIVLTGETYAGIISRRIQ